MNRYKNLNKYDVNEELYRKWNKFTCKNVDVEFHFSSGLPCHVFKILKQTFPSLYKFGLNLTVWFPVVSKLIDGGDVGYSFGK